MKYYVVNRCVHCPHFRYKWWCGLTEISLRKEMDHIPDWCELPDMHWVMEESK